MEEAETAEFPEAQHWGVPVARIMLAAVPVRLAVTEMAGPVRRAAEAAAQAMLPLQEVPEARGPNGQPPDLVVEAVAAVRARARPGPVDCTAAEEEVAERVLLRRRQRVARGSSY